MSTVDFNLFLLITSVFLLLSNVLGRLSSYLKQPKVVAEIGAGILIGPSVLGYLFPGLFNILFKNDVVGYMSLVKEIGLIFLMFCSGFELRHLEPSKHIKECFWGILFGVGIPVTLGLVTINFYNFTNLIGQNASEEQLHTIIILSIAVTSIPVISRIFFDLDMLKTNFAKMVLSIALIEDLIIYGVLNSTLNIKQISFSSIAIHISVSAIFLIIVVLFRQRIYNSIKNAVKQITPQESNFYLSVILALLFFVTYLGNFVGISSMISSFACGMIVGATQSDLVEHISDVIKKFSFAIFIPFYFVTVGWSINLSSDFSLKLFLLFFFLSTFYKFFGGYLAGRISRLGHFKSFALAITLNARGGPGIVIATLAYDYKLINSVLFTTLILTSLATSSLTGMVLEKIKNKLD